MSFWDIEPADWFSRGGRRLFGGRRGDIFGQFDEMRREIERMFEEQFRHTDKIAKRAYKRI